MAAVLVAREVREGAMAVGAMAEVMVAATVADAVKAEAMAVEAMVAEVTVVAMGEGEPAAAAMEGAMAERKTGPGSHCSRHRIHSK